MVFYMDNLQQTGLAFAPIIHLTDLHLTAGRTLLPGGIDPWQRLGAALEIAGQRKPLAVVVTGDIGDRAERRSPGEELLVYEQAREIFEEFSEHYECPVITTPGNHDWEGAIDGFNPDASQLGPTIGDTVTDAEGYRIIGLNTHGYGEEAGRLSQSQIDWLADVLRTASRSGTVLAMHHPPFTSMAPGLSGRGLAFPGRLEQAIAGTDVKLILCGHYHSGELSILGTTPVWSGLSLSYNTELLSEPGTLEESSRGGFSIVNPLRSSAAAVALFAGQSFRTRNDGTMNGFVMHARAGC